MEDSFRVRVDKVFGSLGTETPSSDPSLWCLTDQEIERRHWNRPNKEDEDEEDDDDDDQEEEEGVKSGPSDLANQAASDLLLQQLSESNHEDEDGAEEITKKDKGVVDVSPKTIVDEDWDIESNIGRDCTLDYEEEEDEFDKVAAGMEQIGDRLYMKDVKFGDYETHELNTYGELPTSYEAVVRDPRANHMAAKIRLKEDADTAGNFDTLQLSDNSEMNLKVGHLDDVDNPKPILKKRETSVECRSQKRVRFMLDDCEEQQQPVNGLASEVTSSSLVNDGAMPKQPSRQFYDVPDYVKNPSKYTHYTFDSCGDDMDDQSNQRAFAELFHQLRGGREKEENSSSVDIPKSIVFTPKRKQEQPKGCKENSEGDVKKKGLPVGVTAEESQDVMEEDEPCLPPKKTQKPDRQYRARTNPIPTVDENIDLDVD